MQQRNFFFRFSFLPPAVCLCVTVIFWTSPTTAADSPSYAVTETGQTTCYSNESQIDCPAYGAAFYGQDAQYQGIEPQYRDNGDGTVTDRNTILTWQKAHNAERLRYYAAKDYCSDLMLGGYDDWRLPSIKELYSITDFRGVTGTRPFIDARVFDIEEPDESVLIGDRFQSTHSTEMMGQTWSSTLYTGNLWDRDEEAAFFFNFLDGRIKSAPTAGHRGLFYRCVRGPAYGKNQFMDNGDDTVTDRATGLMWQKADDGRAKEWQAAMTQCEISRLAGFEDWRLPNVKELQSIVDYSRHDPALNPVFEQQDPEGWFWSSTTFGDDHREALYVCFGKCVSDDGIDVHGAGAQRSDPKTGDPRKYRGGRGGQKDQIRIFNYNRCVRGQAERVAGDTVEENPRSEKARPESPPPQQRSERRESPSERRNLPPDDALRACRGKNTVSECSFQAPHGRITGTCRRIHGQLACVPSGGPR